MVTDYRIKDAPLSVQIAWLKHAERLHVAASQEAIDTARRWIEERNAYRNGK